MIYFQVSVLICMLGLCHGGLVKRDADANADASVGHGYQGAPVGPVAHNTQCHTEYDVVTSEACNTVTEQACTTVSETVTDYR